MCVDDDVHATEYDRLCYDIKITFQLFQNRFELVKPYGDYNSVLREF